MTVTVYRYTLRMLATQYIQGFLGVVLMAGPLFFATTTRTMAVILGIGAAAFIVYILHTLLRHGCVVECSDGAIAVSGPVTRNIQWTELRDLRLKYFSTRRDGRNGWMQLVLRGPHATIRIESTLTGFRDIVAVAVKAAHHQEIALSLSTAGNIEVLGLDNTNFISGNGSPCRIS